MHDFNEYSNHAPLTFSMLLNTHIVSNSEKRYCTYRWNEVHRDIFLQTLNRDLHLLGEIVHSQQPVNETVEFFSNYICSRAQPFFEKSHNNSPNVSFAESNYKSKECWFDDICTQKTNTYLEALRTFNCLKNDENRRVLREKKRDYKFYCAKRKRQGDYHTAPQERVDGRYK